MDQQNVYASPAIHGVFISMTSPPIYNDNCSGTPASYFLPDDEYSPPNSKYKTDFAMVLSALLNVLPVQFYISGCTIYGNSIIGVVRLQ
jgi:hypothetical protein